MTLRTRLALTVLATAIPLVAGIAWLRADMERRTAVDRLREVAVTHMDRRGWRDHGVDATRFGGHLESRRRGPRRRGGPVRPGEGRRPPGMGEPRMPPPRGGEDDVRPEGVPPPDGRRPGLHGPENPHPQDGRSRRFRGPPHDTYVWVYDEALTCANPAAPAFPEALRGKIAGGSDEASARFERDGRTGYQLAMRMLDASGVAAVVLVQRVGEEEDSAVSQMVWGSIVLAVGLLCAVLFAAGPIVRRVRLLTKEVRRSANQGYAEPVSVRGSDEIARLATAFNEAGAQVREHVQDLEQREKTLRGFVANTTHDVMIPLTVLQGHLSTLRADLERGQAADPERVVSSLEEAHYIGSLLHNLSAVAKLEAGARHVHLHPVDLNALVERAVARHRPMARAREIEVDYAVPETVVEVDGDVTLLEQAVSNLVQNAVRYNDPGGHVAVVLTLETPADAASPPPFRLRVLDDGPGMPEEELARMPERRFRGDEARTRNPEGLGLGLNIAWDVAERHGLTLAFRASEYGGLEAELSGPTRYPSS